MPAHAKRNRGHRGAGAGGNIGVVVALAAVGLIAAVLGGVVSSRYAAKADSAWNSEGYAKAYRDASRAFKSKNPGRTVDSDMIDEIARRTMWLPRYVPGVSRAHQRTANIYGTVGFLGFVLIMLALVKCIYDYRREIYRKLEGKRVYREDGGQEERRVSVSRKRFSARARSRYVPKHSGGPKPGVKEEK